MATSKTTKREHIQRIKGLNVCHSERSEESYAKGSCGEVRTQVYIYIGIEIRYITKETGEKWIRETVEISSMLAGLIKTKRSLLK